MLRDWLGYIICNQALLSRDVVFMDKPVTNVLCTGHLLAISSRRVRCCSSNSPSISTILSI